MSTKFELNEMQQARVDAWFKHHFETVSHVGRDYSGAAVKFSFIPTGLGPSCKVECLWCVPETSSHSIDFSEDDDGEFATDYDETWKVIPFNYNEYWAKKMSDMKALNEKYKK